MRRFNTAMALRWIIYLPVILPICIVFGGVFGVYKMTAKALEQMLDDIDL